jgi:hypothetical protein
MVGEHTVGGPMVVDYMVGEHMMGDPNGE